MQKLCSKTEIKAPEMASGTSGILLKLEEYLEGNEISTLILPAALGLVVNFNLTLKDSESNMLSCYLTL